MSTPTQSGCLCPPPIRDKDGDWYQDTHPSCPIHRGEAPNLGPRGSTRENAAQERGRVRDLRGRSADEVVVDDPIGPIGAPRTFRPESSTERAARKAGHRAMLHDIKERLAQSGPPRFPEGE
jgi:hypothetical protein